jgi:hypothetical protein
MPRSDDEVISLLRQTRDMLIERRIDILTHPKPSYNIDGQEFKWNEYLKQLNETLKNINNELQAAEGPFEVESVAWT